MSEIKLLPCPFCGGEARMLYIHEELGECCVDSTEELEDETISAFIHCYGCSTEVFPREAEKPQDVIEAWNTRKPIEDMVKQLEKASDYYECDEQGREHVQMVDLSKAIDIVRGGRE